MHIYTRTGKLQDHFKEKEVAEEKKPRGFALMTQEKRSLIAQKGGIASHEKGTAHMWTRGRDGTAAKAGRKGGKVTADNRRKRTQPPETTVSE